jgi:hypothetical protein
MLHSVQTAMPYVVTVHSEYAVSAVGCDAVLCRRAQVAYALSYSKCSKRPFSLCMPVPEHCFTGGGRIEQYDRALSTLELVAASFWWPHSA